MSCISLNTDGAVALRVAVGLEAHAVLAALTQEQERQATVWIGIDAISRRICNVRECGILEPLELFVSIVRYGERHERAREREHLGANERAMPQIGE